MATFEEFKKAAKDLMVNCDKLPEKELFKAIQEVTKTYLAIEYVGSFASNEQYQAGIVMQMMTVEIAKKCPDFNYHLHNG